MTYLVEQAIARVLELDEKATRGDRMPRCAVFPHPHLKNEIFATTPWGTSIEEAADDLRLITEYRTLAPKLARALEIAMKALQECADYSSPKWAQDALESINAIFEEKE